MRTKIYMASAIICLVCPIFGFILFINKSLKIPDKPTVAFALFNYTNKSVLYSVPDSEVTQEDIPYVHVFVNKEILGFKNIGDTSKEIKLRQTFKFNNNTGITPVFIYPFKKILINQKSYNLDNGNVFSIDLSDKIKISQYNIEIAHPENKEIDKEQLDQINDKIVKSSKELEMWWNKNK